jgi:hypothetical protein
VRENIKENTGKKRRVLKRDRRRGKELERKEKMWKKII